MDKNGIVAALGFFDGVHLGHGALLRRAAEEGRRRGVPAAVFTWSRPPKEVVTGVPVPLLNTPEDRSFLARQLYGIRKVVMLAFDREMMTTSWEAFVRDILVKRYGALHLVAGEDHRFGYRNEGTAERLAALCGELGLGCDIVPEVVAEGAAVRSSRIRDLLARGETAAAAVLLGHPHILTRRVEHGRRIGRTIGVPTVNFRPPASILTPERGVYAARMCLPDGSVYDAVTNVGIRPTVGSDGAVTVESWLLDFAGDLYGKTLRLEFYGRLRPEVRFASLPDLRRQIERDAAAARALLRSLPPGSPLPSPEPLAPQRFPDRFFRQNMGRS